MVLVLVLVLWANSAIAKARSIGLHFFQRLYFAQGSMATAGKFLVLRCSRGFPGHLLIAQSAFGLCRVADHHTSGRALKAGFHKRSGTDQGFGADDGVVHDYSVHAHQGIAANTAAVQNSAMADVTIFLDHAILVGEAVHHTGVLNVAALAQNDAAEVASQHSMGADVAVFANNHIADQNSSGVDIGCFMNNGNQVFNGVVGHMRFGFLLDEPVHF